MNFKKIPAVKKLLAFAKSKGYKVAFTKKKTGWAYGFIDIQAKTISVCLRDLNGRYRSEADIVFILAHEIRHLMHASNPKYFRKYAKYYDTPWLAAKWFETKLGFKNHEKALEELGLATERECDAFAKKFVKKNMPGQRSVFFSRVYPAWRINFYCVSKKNLKIRRKQTEKHSKGAWE